MTSRLTTWAWRGVLALAGRRRHGALSLFGPAILIAAVGTWVLLLWAGWVFVFASEYGALVVGGPPPQAPAGWGERIWFVAYSVSTTGNGDFVPATDRWRVIASVTALSGFFLASLVISYLLSVLSAVVQKRAFAGQMLGFGLTAEDVLRNAWDGDSFRTLELPLSSLSAQLGPLAEQYRSYPVLQYYHAAERTKSPAAAVAVLDEVLTLLCYAVPADRRPNRAIVHSARAAVQSFLETLPDAFIDAAERSPPIPALAPLRAAGIPVTSDEAFANALVPLDERRRKLLGLVRNNGWTWREGD